jgi:carbamoylphosphate synthase large subunit
MKILFIGARLFDDVAPYVVEKGITSVLSESNPNSPNLEIADSVHIVSRGMAAPMELAIKEDVDAVVPLIGIDGPLMELAQMKEELEGNYGIPVVASNIQSASISTNKSESKHFFVDNHIKTPSFKKISRNGFKDDFDNLKFPLVLKQDEGQGGRGIKITSSHSEIECYFQEFDQAMAEEFIVGFEISVEVLSWKGDSIPLVPVFKGKTTLNGLHPLDKIKSAPSELEGLDNGSALKLAHHITRKLGSEGNTDVDLIFNQDSNDLYAIEMNTRPSGTRYLTTASSGINPMEQMVDMAMGEWKSKNVKKCIKNFQALEVPVGKYNGPRNVFNPKIFSGDNSWVVHGPNNFERVTIRGKTKNNVSEIAKSLNIDLSSFEN